MNWFRKSETASDNALAPASSKCPTKAATSSKQVRWAEDLVTVYIYPSVWESDEAITGITIVRNKSNKNRNQLTSNCPIDIEYVYGSLVLFGILIFLGWYLSR